MSIQVAKARTLALARGGLNVVVLENTFQLLQYRIGVVEVRYLDMCQHQSGLCCILQISESSPLRAVSDRMGHTTLNMTVYTTCCRHLKSINEQWSCRTTM
jgi:hypothetical protein